MKALPLCLSIGLLAVSPLVIRADEKSKKLTVAQLPPAVRKTVEVQARGAKIKAVSSEVADGRTVYEVELRVNGRSKDVSIDESGAVIEIEEEIPVAELPAPVKAAAEKVGKILKAEAVTRDGTVVAYEVDVKSAGKKSELKIAPDGSRIGK